MPSGGYGVDQEDVRMVRAALNDETVRQFQMQIEWCATYATARANCATPAEASRAAYEEWDL